MSRSDNLSVLEGFGTAVNSGHLGEIGEYVASGSVDHDPAPGQGPGPEGYEEMFGAMRRAFPICTSRSNTSWPPTTRSPSRTPSPARTSAS